MASRGDGRPPYFTVVRIVAAAAAHWQMIDGTTTADLMELPLDRFCNRVVEWVRSRMTTDKFELWLFQLETPPIDAEVDEVEEMRRFRETMGKV